MKTILVILVLFKVAATVYYFEFYKKGKINDKDGDFIPDEIEDAVEEIKSRAKAVKKEIKDVVEQSKDVVDAAKGKKRRGRKSKAKK